MFLFPLCLEAFGISLVKFIVLFGLTNERQRVAGMSLPAPPFRLRMKIQFLSRKIHRVVHHRLERHDFMIASWALSTGSFHWLLRKVNADMGRFPLPVGAQRVGWRSLGRREELSNGRVRIRGYMPCDV